MVSSKPVYVFIPVYNEEENIEEVVRELKELRLNLKTFVIDDGSTDKTAEKARKAGATVISHPINLGGGAAIRTAFTLALLMDTEYIVTLDGDGQHDPKELPKIIKEMENGGDLVIGSRFLERQRQRMPLYRLWGINFFSWLTSFAVKTRITDAMSCYRIYKKKMVRMILPELRENQYYGIELIIKMASHKAKIKEIPIKSIPRTKGKSKKGVLLYGCNLMRTILVNV